MTGLAKPLLTFTLLYIFIHQCTFKPLNSRPSPVCVYKETRADSGDRTTGSGRGRRRRWWRRLEADKGKGAVAAEAAVASISTSTLQYFSSLRSEIGTGSVSVNTYPGFS